ncbi:MAG: glycosyltransferase family 4 protein, partial [Eubacterium sp.]
MKILITTDWYEPAVNGVVASVKALAEGLQEQGHEVRILTLSQNHSTMVKGNVTRIGSIGIGKIYPNARLRIVPARRAVQNLIDWHPDIVHSQCEFSTFLTARHIARSCGVPLLHTYHTVYEDYTHYFAPGKKIGKVTAAWFSRGILALTDRIVVPTEKTRTLLYDYKVHKPICVIPSGLNLERFSVKRPELERHALRKRLGFSENDLVLVNLGRLAKEKNTEELLRYFAEKNGEISGRLKLLIVGDGPDRAALQKLSTELAVSDRVVFTGMVDPEDVGAYYRAADLFVSASQSETQGLTYIEAMACGLPLLCRADPCLNGVLSDGVTGFAYTQEDGFQKALNVFIKNPQRRMAMGKQAEAAARGKWSKEAFAAAVEKEYRAAIRDE